MQFDPQKSLFELPIVRLTAFASLGLAAIITAVIAAHTTEPLALDGDSINHGIDLFKVPLGVLAIGLTLIGIYGANHRSEQTKRQIERTSKQIELTQNQNNFSNYYKHIEEFEKYSELHGSGFKITSTRNLYKKIFPLSHSGDYRLSSNVISGFTSTVQQFVSLCRETDDFNYERRDDYYRKLAEIAKLGNDLLSDYGLNETLRQGTEVVVDMKTVFIPGGSPQALFTRTRSIFLALNTLFRFSLDYKTPDLLLSLAKVDSVFISTINITSSVIGFKLNKLLEAVEV